MKLPITDQFLWDIYNIASKAGNAFDFKSINMANYLPGVQNPVFKKYRSDRDKAKFAKLIYYLKTNNYIQVKDLQGKKAIILTKEGFSKALKASFAMEGKKKRKDGKWTMLIFDMPSKNRQRRTLMRSILQNLGYKMFQQSVWITPYDVSDKTESYLQIYSLDKYVKIFLIEEI
ncbi:MAG: CRISPR-associated endonuclease Cas2 [Candidatus Staskawiczbacteria bacterium]|nr:CRISPR-associated endonuclease Cas2 [Candidatus Staskawiczbacteria bacterium]